MFKKKRILKCVHLITYFWNAKKKIDLKQNKSNSNFLHPNNRARQMDKDQ